MGFAKATFINGKTQIAKAAEASPIIIPGLTRDEKVRSKLAREFGADAVVNVEKENLLETVKKMTDGIGSDVVVESTGSPRAVEDTLDLVRPGGRILISGGWDPRRDYGFIGYHKNYC